MQDGLCRVLKAVQNWIDKSIRPYYDSRDTLHRSGTDASTRPVSSMAARFFLRLLEPLRPRPGNLPGGRPGADRGDRQGSDGGDRRRRTNVELVTPVAWTAPTGAITDRNESYVVWFPSNAPSVSKGRRAEPGVPGGYLDGESPIGRRSLVTYR